MLNLWSWPLPLLLLQECLRHWCFNCLLETEDCTVLTFNLLKKLFSKNGKNLSYSKRPEMARKLIKNGTQSLRLQRGVAQWSRIARRQSVSDGFPQCAAATHFLYKVLAWSLDPPYTSPNLKNSITPVSQTRRVGRPARVMYIADFFNRF